MVRELVTGRIDQATFAASLDPAELSHAVRVWQVAPICETDTAVLPVRNGCEARARELVLAALERVPGPDGRPPRNAIGVLEPGGSRRGMRFVQGSRASWPTAELYLEFMPAGSDMVYAHYALAYRVLADAAPLLMDARWYAVLSQCEDVVDRWDIVDGALRFERLLTEEDHARIVLAQLEPSLA
jgi:hypothetical protein